jgi:hypothetical protein
MKTVIFIMAILTAAPSIAALPDAVVEKPASVMSAKYAGFNIAILVHIYMHLLMVPDEKETKPSLLEMIEVEIMRGVQ